MISEHLEVSSEQYPNFLNNKLIHPIHKIDAEIIDILIGIVEKTQWTSLIESLKHWKYLKDEEVKEQLIAFANTFDQSPPEAPPLPKDDLKQTSQPSKDWIKLGDFCIELSRIHSYECQDEYNFVTECMEYRLVINPLSYSTPSVISTTTNKIIIYSNASARDRDADKLNSYLKQAGIKFVNNTEDE